MDSVHDTDAPIDINAVHEVACGPGPYPWTFARDIRLMCHELKRRRDADPPTLDHGDLIADPERADADGFTQIYVRAWTDTSRTSIKPTDIAQLELSSLLAWMRSRGGMNKFAEQALALVCGHDPAEVQKVFGEELLRL